MVVIEEGISNKSFAISMVSTVLGLASIPLFLHLSEKAPTWLQLIYVAISMVLLAVGFLGWIGKFDKKKELVPVPVPVKAETVVEEKVKPAPKEDWATKWMKENS